LSILFLDQNRTGQGMESKPSSDIESDSEGNLKIWLGPSKYKVGIPHLYLFNPETYPKAHPFLAVFENSTEIQTL